MKSVLFALALTVVSPAAFGTCQGYADSCSYMTFRGQFNCQRQRGCSWDLNQKSCTGFVYACYSLYSQFECQDQSGCYWQPDPRQMPVAKACE